MVNYKNQFYNILNVGADGSLIRWTIFEKDGLLVKRLNYSGTNNSTISLKDVDGVDYQVPSGKKARIIYVFSSSAIHTSQYIISATAANSNTGAVTIMTYFAVANMSSLDIYVSPYVAENLYINHRSADATQHDIICIIEERNA